MKESREYLEEDLLKQRIGTHKVLNGFLAIGLFHYIAWIAYSLINWIF